MLKPSMNIWNHFLFWLYEHKSKKLNAGYEYQAATPELTANRFKLLFNLHGIEISEIPEVKGFESITLHDLNANDRLLQKLSTDFLEMTAEKFGIRMEWLRSGEPKLYSHRHWYKESIVNFFEDLKEVDFETTYDPFIVITTRDIFDIDNPEYQPFILVLRKYLWTVGEKDIYKYYMESVWDWHHPPCRLQAKALATKYYELTRRIITMYKVNNDTFHKIIEGYIPPHDELLMFNHKVSFEEYAAAELPHIQEYEQHEFNAVIRTMKDYRIDAITYRYIRESEDGEEAIATPKRKVGRKPSRERKEIKERYLEEFGRIISRGEISADKAARDFFKTLSEKERVLMFRSPREYETLTYEEAEERAERTLSEYYAGQRESI